MINLRNFFSNSNKGIYVMNTKKSIEEATAER